MMSFCKRSVHSFLGLGDSGDYCRSESARRRRNMLSTAGGLSLIAGSAAVERPVNVVESAAVKRQSLPETMAAAAEVKRDPGGVGFLDDVGGSVNGLMSCTESLGFESSDERRTDDQVIDHVVNSSKNEYSRLRSEVRSKMRKERREKTFPPLISSLNRNGQPSFFLRPVRTDGRLELTEVRIDRPEILRASRQDGRLRLHLIQDEIEEDSEIKEEEEEEEEWRFPAMVTGGGDGFRRCNEAVGHHNQNRDGHNHFGVWSHQCVTSR